MDVRSRNDAAIKTSIFRYLGLLCLACFALISKAQADSSTASNLVTEEFLLPNQSISTFDYYLIMQSDGNLVLYSYADGKAHWASNTMNKGAYAVMQPDGNLVVYNWSGTAVWSSRTNGYSFAHLTLQDDRNLVVYDTANHARWASNTQTSAYVPAADRGLTRGAEKTTAWLDLDLPGNDYSHYTMAASKQPLDCANSCAQDKRCAAFTYVPAGVQASTPVCWLKSAIGSYKFSSNMASGWVTRFAYDGPVPLDEAVAEEAEAEAEEAAAAVEEQQQETAESAAAAAAAAAEEEQAVEDAEAAAEAALAAGL